MTRGIFGLQACSREVNLNGSTAAQRALEWSEFIFSWDTSPAFYSSLRQEKPTQKWASYWQSWANKALGLQKAAEFVAWKWLLVINIELDSVTVTEARKQKSRRGRLVRILKYESKSWGFFPDKVIWEFLRSLTANLAYFPSLLHPLWRKKRGNRGKL